MSLAHVSVVICAYTEDRWSDLVEAVESVLGQTLLPREVIVVIDHNPALLERSRDELRGTTVIPNAQAQGLSGARNSGIAAATGDIIAFLDDDAVASPDWLAHLVAGYQIPAAAGSGSVGYASDVIGVGGAIEPAWEIGRPGWFPREFDWVVGCTYEGMPTKLASARNLIGANMSLRREVFEQVGGFRHGIGRVGTLPLGCEETELCIRAQQQMSRAGVNGLDMARSNNSVDLSPRILYDPSARVLHRVPATRGTWRYFCSRCFAEGLSKAQISRLVGSGAGTETERRYATRTLPRGVSSALRAAIAGDRAGLPRAAAIVAGLAITAAGYAAGMGRAFGQEILPADGRDPMAASQAAWLRRRVRLAARRLAGRGRVDAA